jgi:hypothetical protein
VLGRGAHALEDAPGGEDRGVAGAAVLHAAAGDELVSRPCPCPEVGADAAGGDVTPAEGLDDRSYARSRPSDLSGRGRRLRPSRRQIQPGHRGLVAMLRQVHTSTALLLRSGGINGFHRARPEHGGIDGNDRL